MSIMCALSPFAMSFLVPAFPAISREFGKSVADIQLLLSVFVIGLGVAQPVHGILADRFGRRPVLLVGFAVFVVASIASVMTTSWNALILCRFLQAVGVSVGTVTSRATINDVQSRDDAAVTLSYVSMAMGVGPIIAPVLGGLFDELLGWRMIFAGCAFAGLLILALAVYRLPETKPRDKANPIPIAATISNYGVLLKSPPFIGYTLMFGLGQGVFFAFLAIAPDYFENVLGVSTTIFVTAWLFLCVGFMTGSLLGTRLVKRHGMDKSMAMGAVAMVLALLVMVFSIVYFGENIWSLVIPLFLAMLGSGVVCPLALTGSISAFPKIAGTASGLSSSVGLITGGSFAVFSGHLYDLSLMPYLGLAAIGILGNLLALGLTRVGRPKELSI